MNAELAKKRIASYLRGNITQEELDAFIDGFGDDLTEEAYAEFLREEFEKFVAAENTNGTQPEDEDKDASEVEKQSEQKKRKRSKAKRSTHMRNFSWGIKIAAVSFLFVALCNFEFKCLRLLFPVPENLLTLKD